MPGDGRGLLQLLAANALAPANAEIEGELQFSVLAYSRLQKLVPSAPPAAQGGQTPGIQSVAFSADGSRLASGGQDGTLRLWDAKSGQAIGAPLKGHEGPVRSVAFSPDGSRLAAGGDDGTLRLWPAPASWPSILCAKLTRNMSREEWKAWISPDIDYRIQCPGLPGPN